MTIRWIAMASAVAAILSATAAADQIPTLGQVDRVNWLWLPSGPRDAEAGKPCAIDQIALPEDLGQVLRRVGFPAVADIADDPDFLLPTFTFYAAAEPVAGTRCAISAYATLEMPAPGAEFGFPRVVLWQAPMAVTAVESGGDQPGAMVRYTLQGMIEVMALGFIGTWQASRGEGQ